ncbi:MAG: NAD(P)H-dependent oxidoreductase, partial [Lewinella sp.]|nr:NAD(P)H-dependent oxidoreductase [Lewinella sp.]
VNQYMERIALARGLATEALQGFADAIRGSIKGKSDQEIADWNRRQAYIALGTLLSASASLRIDACPMEGFDANKFSEILGLAELGLGVAVIAPVGYRSSEDGLQHAAKVRYTVEELFIER